MPFAPVSQLIRPLCLLLALGGGAIAVSRAADQPVRESAGEQQPAASPELRELFDSGLGAVRVIGEQKEPDSQAPRMQDKSNQSSPGLHLLGEWGEPKAETSPAQNAPSKPEPPQPPAPTGEPATRPASIYKAPVRPIPTVTPSPGSPARGATASARPNVAKPAFLPIPDDVELPQKTPATVRPVENVPSQTPSRSTAPATSYQFISPRSVENGKPEDGPANPAEKPAVVHALDTTERSAEQEASARRTSAGGVSPRSAPQTVVPASSTAPAESSSPKVTPPTVKSAQAASRVAEEAYLSKASVEPARSPEARPKPRMPELSPAERDEYRRIALSMLADARREAAAGNRVAAATLALRANRLPVTWSADDENSPEAFLSELARSIPDMRRSPDRKESPASPAAAPGTIPSETAAAATGPESPPPTAPRLSAPPVTSAESVAPDPQRPLIATPPIAPVQQTVTPPIQPTTQQSPQPELPPVATAPPMPAPPQREAVPDPFFVEPAEAAATEFSQSDPPRDLAWAEEGASSEPPALHAPPQQTVTPAAAQPAPLPVHPDQPVSMPYSDFLDEPIPSPDAAGVYPAEAMAGPQISSVYAGRLLDPHLTPIPADVASLAMEALSVDSDQYPAVDFPNVGTKRVPFATFAIDSAHPQNALRLRFSAMNDIDRPDRNEYLWGKIGSKGPANPERLVNINEFSLYSETSTGSASGFIELPIRSISPTDNDSTTGLGDLQIGAKSVLLEGSDFFWLPTPRNGDDRFRISTVFRTYLSLSSRWAARGLTTGHTALEPGLLATYQYSPKTHFHAEFKYWIPLGGTSDFAGDVIRYGAGVSHVLCSGPLDTPFCDTYAIIPTLEVVGWEYLFGSQTLPSGVIENTNSISAFTVQPGVRLVLGDRVEIGANAGFNTSENRLYEDIYRLEVRWFW